MNYMAQKCIAKFAVRTVVLLLLVLPASGIAQEWKFQWQEDKMTGVLSCLTFAPRFLAKDRSYESNLGFSYINISIQDNGELLFVSKGLPFHPEYLDEIGIRVGQYPAIFGPRIGRTANSLRFDVDKSAVLITQMMESQSALVQLVFFPSGKTVQTEISLDGAGLPILQASACYTLKRSEGWAGLFVLDVPPNDVTWNEHRKRKKQLPNTAVIVFGVHPRKAAANAGVEVMDYIFSVDDQPASVQSVIGQLANIPEDGKAVLQTYRPSKKKIFARELAK